MKNLRKTAERSIKDLKKTIECIQEDVDHLYGRINRLMYQKSITLKELEYEEKILEKILKAEGELDTYIHNNE